VKADRESRARARCVSFQRPTIFDCVYEAVETDEELRGVLSRGQKRSEDLAGSDQRQAGSMQPVCRCEPSAPMANFFTSARDLPPPLRARINYTIFRLIFLTSARAGRPVGFRRLHFVVVQSIGRRDPPGSQSSIRTRRSTAPMGRLYSAWSVTSPPARVQSAT